MSFYSHGRHSPYNLLIVGIIATVYGISLILRGIRGDTLMPGTLFTYIPRWLFILAGTLLQFILPAAIWFLIEVNKKT